jgi:hypothetical protein
LIGGDLLLSTLIDTPVGWTLRAMAKLEPIEELEFDVEEQSVPQKLLSPVGGKAVKSLKRQMRKSGAKHVKLYSCGPFRIVASKIRGATNTSNPSWRVSITGEVSPTDESAMVIAREAVPGVKQWDIVQSDHVVHCWEVDQSRDKVKKAKAKVLTISPYAV